MFSEPTRGASGLWAVDWASNFVHWLAWRQWLHEVLEKQNFPQRLTVTLAWPPTTGEGAIGYASWLREIRESVARDKIRGAALKAVPDIVPPWQEWPGHLARDVAQAETQRRHDWDGLFDHAPIYSWSPRMGFRWYPPMVVGVPEVPTLKAKTRYIPRYAPGVDRDETVQDVQAKYPGGPSDALREHVDRTRPKPTPQDARAMQEKLAERMGAG